MTTLVTGAAGFIGAHVCRELLARGERVHGVDSFSDYYPVALKRDRVASLCPELPLTEVDLADRAAASALFASVKPNRVIHLAAQAGVRHSLSAPHDYADANLVGFLNVLEGCRRAEVAHLVYASSSSVYGGGVQPPFREDQRTDRPLSLYAASKAANELMAHSYAHLYRFPCTGLRLFTVYGPWGRPDMSPVLFARAVLAGRPIAVFNAGRMRRDFTYIDDIVAGIVSALDRPPDVDPSPQGAAPWRIFNLGNHQAVELERFIALIEAAAGRTAIRDDQPMQPGDVPETMADITAARALLDFEPRTDVEQGIPQVVDWCRAYYGDDPRQP